MPTEAFDVGDLKRLSWTTKNLAGALADPTAMALKVRLPDYTLTSKSFPADAEVVHDATGTFHYDLTFALAGRYVVGFHATGAVVEAERLELWARQVEAA